MGKFFVSLHIFISAVHKKVYLTNALCIDIIRLHDYFTVLTILFSENGVIACCSLIILKIGSFQCQKRPPPPPPPLKNARGT